MRVALLHDEVRNGAAPDEADVLVQMDAVAASLAELGRETVRVPCTLDLEATAAALRSARADAVFNLVESIAGQGRLIHLGPSLLEATRLPFTGCSARATFTTSCKPLSKQLMEGAGIATPRWCTLERLERGAAFEPGRYILKSAWEHASRGIDDRSVVEVLKAEHMAEILRRKLPSLAGEGFAEAYIEGREFNLSMLCGEVLPPAEILFDGFGGGTPRIVGYNAKWVEGSHEYANTPRRFEFLPSDRALLQSLSGMARRCWELFGLRGYARVDFRVDAQGKPWVLEVNSNPCLSPDAGFAAALNTAGIDYTGAIRRILEDATTH